MLKFANSQPSSSGSFCQIYRVTDEALIAETAVWPNFFLMNVFVALKGSKLFIIITSSGGGILIAVKNEYNGEDVPELDTNCEIVWAK